MIVLAFAMAAILGMAAITAAYSQSGSKRDFLSANLLGVAAAAVTFFALYLFGGTEPNYEVSRYLVVSNLSAARVSAALLISLLVFIIFAGYPKDQSDFSRSFFMTHKVFFIALIYGAVIMGGTSGVAGAIQALIYQQMSSKVYMYLGTL